MKNREEEKKKTVLRIYKYIGKYLRYQCNTLGKNR